MKKQGDHSSRNAVNTQ